MIDESRFISFKTENLNIFRDKKILCLIPHQDDESIGCGGIFSLIKDRVKSLDFCLITDGSKSDKDVSSETRNKEFEIICKILNVRKIFYMNFVDRDVYFQRDVLETRLTDLIYVYDYIFTPSIFDIHPDHRATTETVLRIFNKCKNLIPTFLYEVNINQLFVNFIVDISSIIEEKKALIKQYKSQLNLINYLEHVISLNKTRVLSVQNAEYAEAFYLIKSLQDVRNFLEYCKILKI